MSGALFKQKGKRLNERNVIMGLFSDICPDCGSKVSKRARFCSKCGRGAPEGWFKCPQCGKWVGNDSKYCPHCNHPLHPEDRINLAGDPAYAETERELTLKLFRAVCGNTSPKAALMQMKEPPLSDAFNEGYLDTIAIRPRKTE